MGVLKVQGKIDIRQFWPAGTQTGGRGKAADADTTKVKITVGGSSFRYQETGRTRFRITRAFEGAKVKGAYGTTPVINSKSQITVRLQGVDAPELHYLPKGLRKAEGATPEQRKIFLDHNPDFRQPLAESATVALAGFLAEAGGPMIACEVLTEVDNPSQVFDVYGRLVGDISVRVKGKPTVLNVWLVQNGWALPSFYASMAEDEIALLLLAERKAKRFPRRPVTKYARDLVLDPQLQYRGRATLDDFDPKQDVGPVLMPKVYRRLVDHHPRKLAGIVSESFKDYLAARDDRCWLLDDFLLQGPTTKPGHQLADFVTGNRFTKKASDIVFEEMPSTVIGTNGKPVLEW